MWREKPRTTFLQLIALTVVYKKCSPLSQSLDQVFKNSAALRSPLSENYYWANDWGTVG